MKNKLFVYAIIAAAIILIFYGVSSINTNKEKDAGTNVNKGIKSQISDGGDLIIPVADITENASFYDYKVDDINMQVIAVKAKDGTIRTAFNTCQVCFDSGRGYYEQDGDYLVCQNCGNRFAAEDVEVSKGGCNPVPIFKENKTVDNKNITISKDFLKEAKQIFENCKS
jgi:uncharacterized membrane protein